MVNDERDILRFRRVQQTFCQLGGTVGQGLMDARLSDLGQAGDTGGHGNRVTGKRARLIDRTGRCQRIHDFTTATECTYRHTAADDFAKTSQIRHDVVILLSTAQRDAETGHHFVDDQQRAELVTNRAQTRQEFRQRRYAVHVAGHRLNDNTGDIVRELFERGANGIQIVIGAGQGMFGEIRRDTRRVGLAEGQRAGTGFHQQAVCVAVITAFELDDFIAMGKAARQTDGAHRGFGAGVHHAHHVHAWHQSGDQFGHFHFHFGRRAKA